MSKKYIPEGSWLACDKGSCPSAIRVSHNNNANIYGSKLASEADLLPYFNIKPMGICTVLFGSCMPAVPKWDDPQDGVTVNAHRLLKEDSTCQCMIGGKIKIYFDRASAAAACVAGEIKMPTEYIKEGFDWVAGQNAKGREARDSMLPGWMKSVAHVSDWFSDAGTGLVEGAVNGVVGMGEGIYQISQDPVGTAEAVGGMVSSGYNSAKEGLTNAYDWASHGDNWNSAYNATTNWVSDSNNWKAAASSAWESTKEAGSWVANNPRTIGTSVGQFIPDVAAAVYTGGTSEAASAARIAAKEAEEEAVRLAEKQAAEKLAKEEAARLAAKALVRGADDVVGEVVVKSEKELAEEAAKRKLIAGTDEHRAARWKEYQERGGKWSKERWDKQYDTNMKNASYGLSREQAYRDQLGGRSETVKTPYTNRQIDISRPDEMYAGQLKTGKVSLTEQAKIDIQKDAALVNQGYKVEYILEKGASKPFIEALKANGIDYKIGPQIP